MPPTPDEGTTWVDPDNLRTLFTLALSAMYKSEVPLYGKLVQIVSDVNLSVKNDAALDPKVLAMRFGDVSQSRLDIERHGAVRLGTPEELRTIREVFELLGLFPVGYYDLFEAGLPMHATCFRPVTRAALHNNPFRVFTSVLRKELIQDPRVKDLALELLSRRNIFSEELLRLLDTARAQDGRLTASQGDTFVAEALKIFKWQGTATATYEEYQQLKAEHPILADITCFATAHINHLTPRTLDINLAQAAMDIEGLQIKERIEGPPSRACPVLLRQTSFLAIEETIRFCDDDSRPISSGIGSHRARFGEIEERGAAVTPTGRALYDRLVRQTLRSQTLSSEDAQSFPEVAYDTLLEESFLEYPDNWDDLRRQGLVYFCYKCLGVSDKVKGTSLVTENDRENWPTRSVDQLLSDGLLEAVPITYEDFLPLSAAGIFQSNLGAPAPSPSQKSSDDSTIVGSSNQPGMEKLLGTRLLDPDHMYRSMEEESILACSHELKIRIVHSH